MDRLLEMTRKALSVKELYGSYIMNSIGSRQKVFDEFMVPLLENKESEEFFNSFCEAMTVMDVLSDNKWCRVGRHNDGGYVICEPNPDDLAALYSFGIADDVSFESYFAKVLNKSVYMYDHTIDALPEKHDNFLWKKLGVCGPDDDSENMMSLPEMIRNNGHSGEKRLFLKMDVEGYEWEIMKNLPAEVLGQFDQIAIELHHILDPNLFSDILKSLENINSVHQLVHIHGNNAMPVYRWNNRNIPDLLEATYIRREGREFAETTRFFPTRLDERNVIEYPEIPLGRYGGK